MRLSFNIFLLSMFCNAVSYASYEPIPDLLPTMYYIPQEKDVSCKGKYGKVTYNGAEVTTILNVKGNTIAKVCTRFYKYLQMEGTGILKDRGEGEVTINYARKSRYRKVGRCSLGEGVLEDLCLLPYHTIAADNKVHKIGEIIYIPKAKGLVLNDGTKHEGFFIVRDTGSAFNGIGAQRVDLFTGLDPDFNNIFLNSGFHHRSPMKAFKVKGDMAIKAKVILKKRFGNLY